MEHAKQKEQYTEPMGLEKEQSKENSSLVTNEPIDDTPLRLIGHNEKYFIAYGQSRVSENYNTREEALTAVYSRDWGILLSTVLCMMKNIERDKKPGETINDMLNRMMAE